MRWPCAVQPLVQTWLWRGLSVLCPWIFEKWPVGPCTVHDYWIQVLDGKDVTPEDRTAAFMAQVQGDAPTEDIQRQPVVYPLRVSSLQFQEQATRSESLCRPPAAHPGHLQNCVATGSSRDELNVATRLGLLGVGLQQRFARAKRR